MHAEEILAGANRSGPGPSRAVQAREAIGRVRVLREALLDLFGVGMERMLMGDGKDDQIEAIAKARAALKATQ